MKQKMLVTIGILVMALFIGSIAAPARAAEMYDVRVNNMNTFTITLTFVGLEIRQFEIAPGKTTVSLPRDTYTHSYYGCGQLNFGTFTVKLKDNEIVIDNCNKFDESIQPAGTERINVRNRTSTSFPIIFIGLDSNKDYAFDLVPGSNRLYLAEGRYSFSYYACSELHYGTFRVHARNPELDIQTCSSSANGGAITNVLSSFKLKNNTGGPVILVLNGHLDYLFAISSGGATMTVEIGYYQYTLWACGTTFDGVLQVSGKGGYILRTPYCSNTGSAQ